MEKKVYEYIETVRGEMEQMADWIFDHPEPGLEEHGASALLEDWLEAHGFLVERGLGTMDTAFRAVYEHPGDGGQKEPSQAACDGPPPSIGFLCEYDALTGMGHACGHHLQGPCILAAAEAVKHADLKKPYRLVVYGTPAEENFSGKIRMISEGCFKDIDVALMMHGSPTTTTDIKSLANYSVTVTYKGVGAHAAISPEKGRSALDALILAFQGVEFLREHVKEDVRIHYTVDSCGSLPVNVVPSLASGTFLLRSYNIKTLEGVFSRFVKVVDGAAMMTETEAEIKVNKKVSNKIPAPKLNQVLMKYAGKVGAPRLSPPREKTGSTDLGNVMQLIPGSCIRVAFVPEGTSPHSQEYLEAGKSKEAHDAVMTGAKILAAAAVELIEDEELLASVKAEFVAAKEKQSKEA